MPMQTAELVDISPRAPWEQAKHLWARLQGRLRTSVKPRQVFVHAAMADDAQDWASVGQSFAGWCAQHPGEVCVLGLSSRWLLNAVVDAALSSEDARQQAAQQWSHYMDLDEAVLQSDWVWRQVLVTKQRLLCAVPKGLIEALQEAARSQGVSLAWVGPWWARAVQTWLADALEESGDAVQDASATALQRSVLSLWEPGLITHIEAASTPGQPGRQLTRVWIEASAQAMVPGQWGIEPAADNTCENTHIWDHEQIAAVLQGLLPADEEVPA